MSSKTVLITCFLGAAFAIVSAGGPLFAQERTASNGAELFTTNCSACHGSDGRGGERAPDIATRHEVVSLSDADLVRIVQGGISGAGMPSFGYLGRNKIDAIVYHLRDLQSGGGTKAVPGDPRLGEALFFGKGECSRCHMVDGRGGFQAVDLSGYGQGHSAADARTAIVDPDRALARAAQTVTVVTRSGKTWQGFIRSEDNFSLVLQTDDGAFRYFHRDQLAHVSYSGHSSMPRDYKDRLSSEDLDNLISYLMKTRPAEKKTGSDEE